MSVKWKIFLIALLLLDIVAVSLLNPDGRLKCAGSHNFEGQCLKCHLTEPKPGTKALFVKNIDILCEECHKTAGAEMSHPSGIKPSFPLPADMKLDWAGKMTCVTCHTVHGAGKYLLVGGVSGKAFCIKCHQGSLLAQGKHGHEVAASSLHQPQYEIKNLNEPLDRESIDCLSCHDGTFSKYQYVAIGSGLWNHTQGIGLTHPIGVDYGQAQRKGRYRHSAALNKKIRLFSGKMGCGSCHSLYSSFPKKLIMSNNGSALCLECHIK
jgi:predicted CXXCH cytochrome family protein